MLDIYYVVIDVFTIYAWIKPLKGKKVKTVLNSFIEIVNESNKLWVHPGRGFYTILMPKWLGNIDM